MPCDQGKLCETAVLVEQDSHIYHVPLSLAPFWFFVCF